jgi:hypothetical protein
MATGAVTARDPKADATTAAVEAKTEAAGQPQQPLTLQQRFHRLLVEIFQGRQEYLGWHQ